MKDVAVTLDVDWAPDFVIDTVAADLLSRRAPATWFVTHDSPAIDRLKEYPDLFELGIHPNFFQGSTQGSSPSQVLRYCLDIVPDAVSMRTHGLFQSTNLFRLIGEESSIEIDVSLFLPRARLIEPFRYWTGGRRMWRIPYVWEDDYEMAAADGVWDTDVLRDATAGPIIIDLHPIHVYLNSRTMDNYESLKSRVQKLDSAKESQVADLCHSGFGTGTFLSELLRRSDVEFVTVSEICSSFTGVAFT